MINERFMVQGKRLDNGEMVQGLRHLYHDKILIVSENIMDFDDEFCAPEYWWVVDPATVEPVAMKIIKGKVYPYLSQCPGCRSILKFDYVYHPRPGYCGSCGQRLDWTL